jgi:hypothetical protein
MAYLSIPRWGLAIDWETSGYSLPGYTGKHQGLAFGAIVYDSATFEPIETIYCELKFDPKYIWDPIAENIHGMSRDYLNKNGMSIEEAAVTLANLIVKYFGTESVQLLGHRVNFDKAFTTWLFDSIGINIEWHPVNIDSCEIGSALMELSKSDDIFDTLGMPPRGKHNALEDIQYTLLAIKKIKEFFILGVANSL